MACTADELTQTQVVKLAEVKAKSLEQSHDVVVIPAKSLSVLKVIVINPPLLPNTA